MFSCKENTISNCLEQQISELELLKSMYPNPDDIIFTNDSATKEIQNFLDRKTEYTPGHLDFTINLHVNSLKLEVCINLPSLYPNEEPDIYVRSNQLNRHQEKSLNMELSEHIKNNYLGEVCLYTAILWLQDSVDNFAKPIVGPLSSQSEETLPIGEENKFVRFWIYSHHIYNKKKREEISKKAKELNLTGFCLPGKPGIICIEGIDGDCMQWWRDIKQMCWKKITLRNTEVFEISEKKSQQKFDKFEEIVFQNNGSYRNCSKHVDMSSFSKYLENHGLAKSFHELLGLYET